MTGEAAVVVGALADEEHDAPVASCVRLMALAGFGFCARLGLRLPLEARPSEEAVVVERRWRVVL